MSEFKHPPPYQPESVNYGEKHLEDDTNNDSDDEDEEEDAAPNWFTRAKDSIFDALKNLWQQVKLKLVFFVKDLWR